MLDLKTILEIRRMQLFSSIRIDKRTDITGFHYGYSRLRKIYCLKLCFKKLTIFKFAFVIIALNKLTFFWC